MAYIATHRDLVPYSSASRIGWSAKPGILRRLYGAIVDARQRDANRIVAKFLARSGGQLTDDIEREMTRRLSSSDWTFRR